MQWKEIPGLPGYEVSDSGQVRRAVAGKGTWRHRRLAGYVEKRGGYLLYRLRCNGTSKLYRAHRLVLMAFVGPPPGNSFDGAHNDGNRLNNSVGNLRWATRADNMSDTLTHGTHSYGERRSWSKLTDAIVRDIRRRWRDGLAGQRQMAREYGVNLGVLQRALRGESWAHVKD